MEVIHKIGRRKTSVARVYMSEGKGNITVNKKDYSDFFSTAALQYKILQPFNLTETKDKFDLSVRCLLILLILLKRIFEFTFIIGFSRAG